MAVREPEFFYMGVISLIVGLLLAFFPGPTGAVLRWLDEITWKGHKDDIAGRIRKEMRDRFPQFAPNYDDPKTPNKIRLLGIVFLLQAVAFFILVAF
jgi:hypothetical protein